MSDASCLCYAEPGSEDYEYWAWAAQAFATCAYTPLDKSAFIIGMMSLILWIVVFAPQIWETFRTKTVESISFGLWAMWIVGDVANLGASVLTQQSTATLAVAVYFCFVDIIIVAQFIYYSKVYPKRQQRAAGEKTKPLKTFAAIGVALLMLKMVLPSDTMMGNMGDVVAASSSQTQRVLMDTSSDSLMVLPPPPPACDHKQHLSDPVVYTGYVLAWIQSLIYFVSRLPQIYKNYKNKYVEGLSPFLFFIALCANISYGVSILLLKPELNTAFWAGTFPFVFCSLGTVVFDVFLVFQILKYRKNKRPGSKSEYEPILDEPAIQA